MQDNLPYTEINVAKVPADNDVGGMLFTVSTMLTFYWGIPLLRYMFPFAILLGCIIALGLRFIRHETPGKSWIPASAKRN